MSLKAKTIIGFKWSLIDSLGKYFLSFIIGIILARLLSPTDYGLIGMSAIFMAVSMVFIDGGFSDALIRKFEPTDDDYTSVFYFNILLAAVFYLLLYYSAPLISAFFGELSLVKIIRISGLGLIIGSTSTIQTVILRKRLDFKLQAIISFISGTISGTVSITMALNDYGVWSLIYSGIISGLVSSLLLWILNGWRPKLHFNFGIIKKEFGFGSKIMIGSFVHVLYNNMYYVLIGKIFTPSALGYFSKADSFQKLVSSNIDITVRQVTYPVLASIQNETTQLKAIYRVMIKNTAFITFVLLLGLASIAEPFILTLIGEKWLPSVPYLQLLCVAGMFFPLISINANVLNVKGRSDISLFIIILRVVLSIPALLLGYYYSIIAMCFGMIFSAIIIYTLILFSTKHFLQYSVKEQISDVFQALKFAVLVTLPVYILGYLLFLPTLAKLLIQLALAVILFIVFGEILKNQEYLLLKSLIIKKKKHKFL